MGQVVREGEGAGYLGGRVGAGGSGQVRARE